MDKIQKKILEILDKKDLNGKSLRQIGKMIGESSAGKIGYHLDQLAKKGLIVMDKNSKMIVKVKRNKVTKDNLVAIPILGAANCGPATLFADSNIMGYLRVSKSLLPQTKSVFAIQAVGSSMNNARVRGKLSENSKTIDDGDYVIIDPENKAPLNGDYVLSIIDDCANIKKFVFDRPNDRIILESESKQEIPPIFIHKNDLNDYLVNGKVVQVIKKSKK